MYPLKPSRRQFLLGTSAAAAAAAFGMPGNAYAATGSGGTSLPPDREIAADVRNEFMHAWNGYKQFAWGHDQVMPLSGTYSEFFVSGHPIGLSIIEALDTLYVMGLDEELALGVDWIKNNLSFEIDGDVHVFEFIIRVLGGLEAGYLSTGDPELLRLSVQAGDLVLPAFTKSPTGMPYQYVNFATGAPSGNTPPIAETGSGDTGWMTGHSWIRL
jgi:mannosyl-oligosaccharide alpha-1,2-mannosidase